MFYRELERSWAELTAPGAPFEMQTIQVRGASVQIFKQAPLTVRDLWLPTEKFGDRLYMVFQDDRVTYAQAHAQAASVANWLLDSGVKPGDCVAISMRNYPEWLIAYWGCLSVGICVVGTNAWWTGDELAYALRDSKPRAIICDQERLDRLLPHRVDFADALLVVTRCDTLPERAVPWSDLVARGGTMPDARIDPDDDACIFYTSGTTAFPKGAQLTHRNCITNIYNILFAGQVQALAMRLANPDAPPAPAPAAPVTLIPTPFFHVTGSNCLAYSVTLRGGVMVLMYKWDAGEALTLIERERISEVSGVPVMSREILHHPQLAQYNTSSLISIAGGGASFQEDLVDKVPQRIPTARPRTGYGMTETAGSITTISADFLVDKPNSVGRILPTFEARFVDDDGREVPTGEVGELWVRGGAVIKGYLNQPEATAETITDGWLHTGDLARIDAQGFLYIVDRKKDMVLRGGENIYCAEVENCVQQHPAVAECCVFGVPDERLGEIVGAAVVLRDGETLTVEALAAYCGATLARHKIPTEVWFLDQPIPRNATGKFAKRDLRDQLLESRKAA
jgi:long-chain acyl-CoA synthetase